MSAAVRVFVLHELMAKLAAAEAHLRGTVSHHKIRLTWPTDTCGNRSRWSRTALNFTLLPAQSLRGGREALLFVIVVVMVATGLLAVRDRTVFRKRNQHLVRCQWRLADRFGWRPVVEGLRRAFLGVRRRLNDANDLKCVS